MPNEPEREIEKSLKAYAQQRRAQAGAPPPLHPAARRVLQGEAARAYRKRQRATRFRPLMWLSLAAGVGLIIVFALPWFSRPKQKLIGEPPETALAFNDYKKNELPAPAQREVPKLPANSSFALSKNSANPGAAVDKVTTSGPLTLASGSAAPARVPSSASTLADVPQNSPAGSLAAVNWDLAKESPATRRDGSLAANQTVTLTPPPAPVIALNDRLQSDAAHGGGGGGGVGGTVNDRNGAVFVTQKFALMNGAYAARKATSELGAPAVLSSFQVERTGDRIRVIDSDGSVYIGEIAQETESFLSFGETRSRQALVVAKDSLDSSGKSGLAPPPSVAPGSPPPSPAPMMTGQNYFFRVSGTNLSLREAVSFSGHLVADNAPPSVVSVAGAAPLAATMQPAKIVAGEKSKAPVETGQPSAPKFRVSGRAIIGGTNEMEINAETGAP